MGAKEAGEKWVCQASAGIQVKLKLLMMRRRMVKVKLRCGDEWRFAALLISVS